MSGVMASGSGYAQLQQLTAAIDLPHIGHNLYTSPEIMEPSSKEKESDFERGTPTQTTKIIEFRQF